ncbi:MAG: radical SAM protein [Candidatus Marsarchaeota archaeon]|jgi:MoaA/NifB/PqqE/SkfB family radical SAM enzyme|nr:radical SAM protein [Candidatus Marsarchaeota archaeon]MCL5111288.1 radical SAM protein [Candidatus Marsarchaeota archaeon]
MAGTAKMASLAMTALKSNFSSLKRPYKLNFCVTYWCQSACLTCKIYEIRPKGELTIEEIRKFAERNSYFQWIELTGGEPFLRSDIVEIAKAFKESCKDLYLMTMPTNSLCNISMVEKRLREILSLQIPRFVVTVSLDGWRELHDKIRGVQGNFDKAMQVYGMIQKLKKEHMNVDAVFGYTMSKFNQGQFEQTYQAVKQLYPDVTYNDFHINLAQASENYYKNEEMDIRPDYGMAAKEVEYFLTKRSRSADPMIIIENAFLKKLVEFAKTGKSPMRSRSLEASLYLDSWGNVYPSIMWNRKIGNIKEVDYDLSKLWHSEPAKEVRKDIKDGKQPSEWTSCEAYQALTGNMLSLL